MLKRSTNEGWYSGRSVAKKKSPSKLHGHREISFATPAGFQSTCLFSEGLRSTRRAAERNQGAVRGRVGGTLDFVLPRTRATDLDHRTAAKPSRVPRPAPFFPSLFVSICEKTLPSDTPLRALLHPNQGAMRGRVSGGSKESGASRRISTVVSREAWISPSGLGPTVVMCRRSRIFLSLPPPTPRGRIAPLPPHLTGTPPANGGHDGHTPTILLRRSLTISLPSNLTVPSSTPPRPLHSRSRTCVAPHNEGAQFLMVYLTCMR